MLTLFPGQPTTPRLERHCRFWKELANPQIVYLSPLHGCDSPKLTPNRWGPLLRYISSPILCIVASFAYPEFYTLRNNPPYIFGFIVAHFVMLAALLGLVMPRYLDVFVPYERRDDGIKPTMPGVTIGILEAESDRAMETGSNQGSDSDRVGSEKPPTYKK